MSFEVPDALFHGLPLGTLLESLGKVIVLFLLRVVDRFHQFFRFENQALNLFQIRREPFFRHCHDLLLLLACKYITLKVSYIKTIRPINVTIDKN